jgi:hypothetical protein
VLTNRRANRRLRSERAQDWQSPCSAWLPCPTGPWIPTAHPVRMGLVPMIPKMATDQRFRWSAYVWSPPPESNRRPHPYHGTTGNRCANRRIPRSRPTVGAEVIGSPSAEVCVHSPPDAEILRASHHPRRACNPRHPLCSGEGRSGRNPAGSEPGGDPPKPPGAAPPGPSTARGVRNPTAGARRETGPAAPRFRDRTLFPGGCPVLSS